ncbi:MAG: response regulator [Magnetococcales bacterium]|nr:response regulator [Magnetococcales bacterium]
MRLLQGGLIRIQALLQAYRMAVWLGTAGLLLTCALFYQARDHVDARIRDTFLEHSEKRRRAIEQGIQERLDSLQDLRSLYLASKSVEWDEFHTFTQQAFVKIPTHMKLAWVPWITGEQRQTFEESTHESRVAVAGFEITEYTDAGTLQTAPRRKAHFPIQYMEPPTPLLGFDLASHPLFLDALERARDSGQAAASAVFDQQGAFGKDKGLLLVLPIYHNGLPAETQKERRQHLHGFYVVFCSIADLIDHSIKNLQAAGIDFLLQEKDQEPFHVHLSRKRPNVEGFFTNRPAVSEPKNSSTLSTQNTVEAVDKPWEMITIKYETSYFENIDHIERILMPIIISLLATAFFTGWVVVLQRDANLRQQAAERLAEALRAAEAASQEKSAFIANMSHEIRTPMNAVIGLSHLAIQSDPPPQMLDYLRKINSSSHTLLSLINDILDFSKMDAGRMRLRPAPFYLSDLLDRLSDLFSEQAADKGLELLFSLPMGCNRRLVGDSLRMEQVLVNLIRNAIKFTEQGSVELSLQTTEIQPGTLQLDFAVRDTGIGIDPAQIEQLFEPFVQLDNSSTRKYAGTGLGLAICKRLTALMGGRIGAESLPGVGSTFHFSLAVHLQQGERENLEIPARRQGIKTLVVDDHPLALEITTTIVRDFGLSVTGAPSGAAALAAFQAACTANEPHALWIVDWQMPGMDGIETIRQARALWASAERGATSAPAFRPKCILLTAFGRESLRQRALEAGADLFLNKPISHGKLWQAVMTLFGEEVKGLREGTALSEEQETRALIGGGRILLVEDNAINQQVATEILQRAGLLVESAHNGLEALRMLNEATYDAVLMDLQMPEMDGLTATRRLRQEARFQKLPIIAMTAHATEEERDKCLAAGMNAHLTKPIQPEKLYATLLRWIGVIAQPATTPAAPPEHPEQPPLPELPGVDCVTGVQRIGGNRTLYRQLLRRFHEENHPTTAEIHRALAAGDIEQAARLLHKLKGVAANLGADALHQATVALEQALQYGDASQKHRCATTFSATLQSLLDGVAAMEPLPETPPPSPGAVVAVDCSAVEPLLGALAGLLEEHSLETEGVLTALRPHLQASQAALLWQEMEQAIHQYHFEAARQCVLHITRLLRPSPAKD